MTNHVIVLPSTVLLSLCAADGQVWKFYLRWHAWRLVVSVVHNFKEHGPQNWTLKLLKWWIQLRGFPRLLQINDRSSDKSRRNRHAQDLHENLRHNFFCHCLMTPDHKSEQTVVRCSWWKERGANIRPRFWFRPLVQPFWEMPQLQMSLVLILALHLALCTLEIFQTNKWSDAYLSQIFMAASKKQLKKRWLKRNPLLRAFSEKLLITYA